MSSLNKVMIIGNLTRDPELRTTATGKSVVSFGVATNQTWTDIDGQKQERAEFHNVVAWGKLAEICNQYLIKGKKIYIDGRLQTRDWQGQDGIKRYRTEIVADNMIMLDRGPQAGNGYKQAGAYPQAGDGSIEQSAQNRPEVPVIEQEPLSQEPSVEEVPF